MIILIVTFLSFLLEYIVNGFFRGTIFTGLIILSSMILLEPYFKKNMGRYFVYCFIVGALYDIIYSGMYFMNAGLFLFIGFLVDYFNRVTPNNCLVSLLELVVLISLYRAISFMFLCLNGVVSFDIFILLRSIYCSIITNLIYGIVLYFILYLISLKFNIKRIK